MFENAKIKTNICNVTCSVRLLLVQSEQCVTPFKQLFQLQAEACCLCLNVLAVSLGIFI